MLLALKIVFTFLVWGPQRQGYDILAMLCAWQSVAAGIQADIPCSLIWPE